MVTNSLYASSDNISALYLSANLYNRDSSFKLYIFPVGLFGLLIIASLFLLKYFSISSKVLLIGTETTCHQLILLVLSN